MAEGKVLTSHMGTLRQLSLSSPSRPLSLLLPSRPPPTPTCLQVRGHLLALWQIGMTDQIVSDFKFNTSLGKKWGWGVELRPSLTKSLIKLLAKGDS